MKEDTKRFLESPYLIDEARLRRFDQRFIGFARAAWDESFKGFGKGISGGAPAKALLGVPGYSRIEYALQAAAWTVYDTFGGGFSWEAPWGSPSNNPGAYKWYVNADECYSFWTANTADCSNCIRVCPYTKPGGALHGVPKFFIRRLPLLNRLWIWADTAFGWDRRADPAWFPPDDSYRSMRRRDRGRYSCR